MGEGAGAESCGPLLRSSEFFFPSVMEATGEFEHETDLIEFMLNQRLKT